MQSSPGGKRCPWPASPSQRQGWAYYRRRSSPLHQRAWNNKHFSQTLTGRSEMMTREGASTPCKAINRQCLMMYTSTFYPRQIHKYSSLIHTPLTFLDENHISFEKERKRQIHQEAYITTHKQVNGGEFVAKKIFHLIEYAVNRNAT